jgi:hypothetical protein
MQWYDGKSCAICGKPLKVRWWGNKPALMSPEGTTLESSNLEPDEIQRLLETHKSVCWSCHLERAFRRAYPGSSAVANDKEK